jgi:hypothetical protein
MNTPSRRRRNCRHYYYADRFPYLVSWPHFQRWLAEHGVRL